MKLLAFVWMAGEAGKAVVRTDHATLDLFAAPTGPSEPSHGGKLHQEKRVDVRGHVQTRWVSPLEQPPASPPPAAPPAPASPPDDGDPPPEKPGKASTWNPAAAPARDDREALEAWLEAAPLGTRLQIGEARLELDHKGWRPSSSRYRLSSAYLAKGLAKAPQHGHMDPDEEQHSEWLREMLREMLAEKQTGRWQPPGAFSIDGDLVVQPPGVAGSIEIAEPKSTVEIPTYARAAFEERMEKLAKRAVKLGVKPPTWTITGNGTRDLEDGSELYGLAKRTVPFTEYTVVIPDLEMPGGWSFIGAIEHTSKGNRVHILKPPHGVDLLPLRSAKSTCDHCRTQRNRNMTVLVQDRGGEMRRVGRDCVKDYLGHDVPITGWQSIFDAMHAELYGDPNDEMWKGAKRQSDFYIKDFLTAAVVAIRANEGRYVGGHGSESTRNAVYEILSDKKKPLSTLKTEDDERLADAVLEWARAIPENTPNDYLHNVRVTLTGDTVNPKEFGYGASAVAAFIRDKNERVQRERVASTSQHVGKPNDVIGRKLSKKDRDAGRVAHPAVEGTVTHFQAFDGDFGTSYLIKVHGDDGNVYSTFSSSPGYENRERIQAMTQARLLAGVRSNMADKNGRYRPADSDHEFPDVGDRLRITGGTVKKHDTFKGVKGTQLTRQSHERLDLPDVEAARTPGTAPNAWNAYDTTLMEWARLKAEHHESVKPGEPGFKEAFEAHLKAGAAQHGVGVEHYVSKPTGYGSAPATQIARERELMMKGHAPDWTDPGEDGSKALLVLTFRGREALKDGQVGLFGLYAAQARRAQPEAWGSTSPAAAPPAQRPGGNVAALPSMASTHIETRTDKTGRTEHRKVRDGKPAQLGLFGGASPVRMQTPVKRSAAPKQATGKAPCGKCGGTIPRMDEHAHGGHCGACRRTIDWTVASAGRPSFSSIYG